MPVIGGGVLNKAVQSREALPLNGDEIKKAIYNHLSRLALKLVDKHELTTDSAIIDELVTDATRVMSLQSRLHIGSAYPKSGWRTIVRLEKIDDKFYFTSEVELDLERNVRLNLRFGQTQSGIVIDTIDDEKIPSNIPDKDRTAFDLPISITKINTDGSVAKMDLRDIRAAKDDEQITTNGSTKPSIPALAGGHTTNTLPSTTSNSDTTTTTTTTTSSSTPTTTTTSPVATPPPPPQLQPLDSPLPATQSMSTKTRPNTKLK